MTQIVFLFTIKLKIAHLKDTCTVTYKLICMTDSLTVDRHRFPSNEEINGI